MDQVIVPQFDIEMEVLDYIKKHYFYVSLNEDYSMDVSNYDNYYAVTVDDGTVTFRAVISKRGILLYCYLTTERLIEFVDDNNFDVIYYAGQNVERVLHYQCLNQVWYLTSGEESMERYKDSYCTSNIKKLKR